MPPLSQYSKQDIIENMVKAVRLESEYATKLRDALQKIADLPSQVSEEDVGKEAVSIAVNALKPEE